MKKIFLVLSLLLLIFITNSYAIDSGTYFCKDRVFNSKFQIILKKSGRAKMLGLRGNWRDYDDEATIIDNQTILEKTTDKKGNLMYLLIEDRFVSARCVDKNSPYLKNMK